MTTSDVELPLRVEETKYLCGWHRFSNDRFDASWSVVIAIPIAVAIGFVMVLFPGTSGTGETEQRLHESQSRAPDMNVASKQDESVQLEVAGKHPSKLQHISRLKP